MVYLNLAHALVFMELGDNMAIQTYVPLANFTATGTTTSVYFTNIPSGYRDLVLVSRPRAGDVNSMGLKINGSGSSITGLRMSQVATYYFPPGSDVEIAYVTNNEAVVIHEFLDYSQTDKHKMILVRESEPARHNAFKVIRWENTAAITSIGFVPNAWALVAGASFELYGIAG